MATTRPTRRSDRSAAPRWRVERPVIARAVAALAGVSGLGLWAAPACADAFRFEPALIDPGFGLERIAGSEPSDASGAPQSAATSVRGGAEAGSSENPDRMVPDLFGAADQYALEADLTGAFDFDGTELAILDVGVQWFVADGISAGIFGEGIYAAQDSDDALGGGGGVLVRWHFVREERVTLFAEFGCAAVWFTDRVPAGGSDFDFSPRASIGASLPLGDVARLDARVGWFHLSNAQTSEGNPGIDALAVGLGLVFPF